MLVEELIKRLEELKNELGNVEVSVFIDDCDGTSTGILPINEVDISTDKNGEDKEIYIAYLYQNEENLEEEN